MTTKSVLKQETNPWTQEQVTLITNTVAKGATPDELQLFLYTASRTGLDPLTRQIHFVKRGGQMTVQTGIDGYRAIAERSGTLAGIDDAQYDSEDKVHPNKATVTVYRIINSERVPFTASARWSEYAVEGGFMWRKMPYLMLAKCAEALALRKAFPNDLTGLYTNEEMEQADGKVEVEKPKVAVEDYKAKLEKTKNTDELKKVWADIPAEAKKQLEPTKNLLKESFEKSVSDKELQEIAQTIDGKIV